MSTTQGPYTCVETDAPKWARHRYKVTGPSGDVTSYVSSAKQGREWLAAKLNAAYAEGQRSNQAELDKAVGLLRAFANADEWVEGISMVFMPQSEWDKMNAAMLAAQAYISTLNPQPDAVL